MLIENKRLKAKELEDLEREKLEDIKAQQAYAQMLEKQEQDRMKEIKAREDRQQLFMNHMADTVIKEQDARAAEEDGKIKRWEQQRELAERREAERRLQRYREINERTKEFLFQQMEDRKRQERIEKMNNDEQAKIWEVDRLNSLQEEKRVTEKSKKVNHDTAAFLKQQIDEK